MPAGTRVSPRVRSSTARGLNPPVEPDTRSRARLPCSFERGKESGLLSGTLEESFCFDCPVGTRAIPCDPFAGLNTECVNCDSSVERGRYCTGAQASYHVPTSKLFIHSPKDRVGGGSFNFTGAPDTAVCPEGYTCSDGQRTECGPNQRPEPSPALYCPAGSGAATPDELLCPEGYYCPDVQRKVVCPEGSACPAGSRSPSPCPERPEPSPASYCPEGSRATNPDEVRCPAGHFCPDVQRKVICPAGSACPAGLRRPSPCSAGSFTSLEGRAECEPCEPGSFQDATGQLSCKSCADLSAVSPFPGATACTACNPLGSDGVDRFNRCRCKPGAFGVTCEPGASRPVSGGNNGTAISSGATPGAASASGGAAESGRSALLNVAACVGALALVAIAVLVATRRREASAAQQQPAQGAELSAQL